MAHFRRPLILLLGLFACAAPGFGQKPPRPDAAPPAIFRVMALTDGIPEKGVFYLKDAKEGLPLVVNKSRLSAPVSAYSTTMPMTFGSKATDPQGAVTYKPMVQAAWPEVGAPEALVFLALSGEGAGAKLSAVAVDNGLKVFPRRTVRVLNFSGQKVFGQFGSFKGELAPGASRAVPYPEVPAPSGSVGRFQVGFGVIGPDGGSQLIFNGWTEAWPNARTLVLISPSTSPGSDRPRVKFLVDNLPPPPKPPGSPR